MATQAANCGERDLPCNVAAKRQNVLKAERLEKERLEKRNGGTQTYDNRQPG
jgi:hypothetical protein